NLNNIRAKRQLSLDDVAALTGVSKAMLGQIERGKSNPTVSTLWKISTGLKVPFSSFMEKATVDYEVVNRYELTPMYEENGSMKIYPIFPFDSNKNFEILTIDLEVGCVHSSPKHDEGVEEYIIVTDGILEMDFDNKSIPLQKGSCLRFSANVNHTYKNIGDEKCTFQNIIVYGK
ncbi:MAG: helix-turn-helix domain-containing protein, partial [Bacillaceae bacterium]